LALASASGRVKAMETALGAALLERRARGVILTEAGAVLRDHARTILRDVAALKTDLAPFAQGVTARVQLLANTASVFEHLPPVLSAYLADHRGISIDVEERESCAIGRAVSEGRADLGVAIADALPAALERRRFCDDVLTLIAPVDDPFAGRAGVRFAESLGRDFIGLSRGSALQGHLAGQAAQLGRQMRLRMRLTTFDAICAIVSASGGIAVIPRLAAARAQRAMPLALVPLADRWAQRQLAICARNFAALPASTRHLAEHLAATAAA
jgi:DNA-binding transcriptional LysR family regulator